MLFPHGLDGLFFVHQMGVALKYYLYALSNTPLKPCVVAKRNQTQQMVLI
jgi:hypothetical protein